MCPMQDLPYLGALRTKDGRGKGCGNTRYLAVADNRGNNNGDRLGDRVEFLGVAASDGTHDHLFHSPFLAGHVLSAMCFIGGN